MGQVTVFSGPERRRRWSKERAAAELHIWLTEQVAKLSRGHDLTKACFYML